MPRYEYALLTTLQTKPTSIRLNSQVAEGSSNSCLDLDQIVHWLRLTPSATPVDKQARRQDALRAPYQLCLVIKRHTSSVNGAYQTPAKRLQLDGSECTLGRLPNTLVLLLKGTFYLETPETLLGCQYLYLCKRKRQPNVT